MTTFYDAPGVGDPALDPLLAEIFRLGESLDEAHAGGQLVRAQSGILSRGLRIREYTRLRREVSRDLDRYLDLVQVWAGQQLPDLYYQGVMSASTLAGVDPAIVLDSRVHATTTTGIVEEARRQNARALASVRGSLLGQLDESIGLERLGLTSALANAGDPLQRRLARQMLGGNLTQGQLRERLLDGVWDRPAGIADSAGRRWQADAYLRMLSRTQAAETFNAGSLNGYALAGVETVTVRDGDSDHACRMANGERWSIRYAQGHVLQHPNCVRTFAPDRRIYGRDLETMADKAEKAARGVRAAVRARVLGRTVLSLARFLDEMWGAWRVSPLVGGTAEEVTPAAGSSPPDNVIQLPPRRQTPDEVVYQLRQVVYQQQQLAVAVGQNPGGLGRTAAALGQRNLRLINGALKSLDPVVDHWPTRAQRGLVDALGDLKALPTSLGKLDTRAQQISRRVTSVLSPPGQPIRVVRWNREALPQTAPRPAIAPDHIQSTLPQNPAIDFDLTPPEPTLSERLATLLRPTAIDESAIDEGTELLKQLDELFNNQTYVTNDTAWEVMNAADRGRVFSAYRNDFPELLRLREALDAIDHETGWPIRSSSFARQAFTDLDLRRAEEQLEGAIGTLRLNVGKSVTDQRVLDEVDRFLGFDLLDKPAGDAYVQRLVRELQDTTQYHVTKHANLATDDPYDLLQALKKTIPDLQDFSGGQGVNGQPFTMNDLFIKPNYTTDVGKSSSAAGFGSTNPNFLVPAKVRLGWALQRMLGIDAPHPIGSVILSDNRFIDLARRMDGFTEVMQSRKWDDAMFDANGWLPWNREILDEMDRTSLAARLIQREDGHTGNTLVKVLDDTPGRERFELVHIDHGMDGFVTQRTRPAGFQSNLMASQLKRWLSDLESGATPMGHKWDDLERAILDRHGHPVLSVDNSGQMLDAGSPKRMIWDNPTRDAVKAPVVRLTDDALGNQRAPIPAGLVTEVFTDADVRRAATREGVLFTDLIEGARPNQGAGTTTVTSMVHRVDEETLELLQALANGDLDDDLIELMEDGYLGLRGVTPGVTDTGKLDLGSPLLGPKYQVRDDITQQLLPSVKQNLQQMLDSGAIVRDDLRSTYGAVSFEDSGGTAYNFVGELGLGDIIDITALDPDEEEPETAQGWVQHLWEDAEGRTWAGVYMRTLLGSPLPFPLPSGDLPPGWRYVQVVVKEVV